MTSCDVQTAANRQYHLALAGWMTLYMGLIFLASWNDDAQVLPRWAVYAVAVGCALPIGGVMAAALRLMASSDEFLRALLTRRFVISTGITFFLCGTWGFLETFTGLVHVEMWVVFPVFWAVMGLVTPFVRTAK